jgi:hypothetical protein
LPLETFSHAASALKDAPPEVQAALQSLQAALTEQTEAAQAFMTDRASLLKGLQTFDQTMAASGTQATSDNAVQHTLRQSFDPLATAAKGFVKHIDLRC